MSSKTKVNHACVQHIETGRIFETYTEAAKSINGNRWGVRYCAMGIQSQHMGQHFRYVHKKKADEHNS